MALQWKRSPRAAALASPHAQSVEQTASHIATTFLYRILAPLRSRQCLLSATCWTLTRITTVNIASRITPGRG